jgi:putative transposase
MRRKRFTEEQIHRDPEGGGGRGENQRTFAGGTASASKTFYRWKNKYGGLELHEARRRCQLEDANARLKRLVADLTLDKQVLKDLLGKKA